MRKPKSLTSSISLLALENSELSFDSKRRLSIAALASLHFVKLGLVPPGISLKKQIFFGQSLNLPYFNELNLNAEAYLTALESILRKYEINDVLELGWLYQELRESERGTLTSALPLDFEERPRNAHEIALVTQTFTDRYIVEFLLEHSFKLIEKDDFTLCDPACGTGHFLIPAFLKLTSEKEIDAEKVLTLVLFGFDIDPEAIEITKLSLLILALEKGVSLAKALAALNKNIICCDHTAGALKRVENERRYTIVATNPPYIARRKMHQELLAYLDLHYPSTSQDLCSAFIERCLELLEPKGVAALLTMNRWLTLNTYQSVRVGGTNFKGVLKGFKLSTLVDCGSRALAPRQALHDSVRLVMSIIEKTLPDTEHEISYLDLSSENTVEKKEKALKEFAFKKVTQVSLIAEGANQVLRVGESSWLSKLPRVADLAEVIAGIQTNDDARYVKYFWEVPHTDTGWIPHHKGGGNGRWAGQRYWLLDWREKGEPYLQGNNSAKLFTQFDRPGWCYSWLANGVVGLRKRYSGESFGRAACGGVYFEDLRLAAVMNSSVFSFFARKFSSKAQLPEGTFKTIPCPSDLSLIPLSLVEEVLKLKQLLLVQNLKEPEHSLMGLLSHHELIETLRVLSNLESQINEVVLEAYDLPEKLLNEFRSEKSLNKNHEIESDVFVENLFSALLIHALGGRRGELQSLGELKSSEFEKLFTFLPKSLLEHITDLEAYIKKLFIPGFFKKLEKVFLRKPLLQWKAEGRGYLLSSKNWPQYSYR